MLKTLITVTVNTKMFKKGSYNVEKKLKKIFYRDKNFCKKFYNDAKEKSRNQKY